MDEGDGGIEDKSERHEKQKINSIKVSHIKAYNNNNNNNNNNIFCLYLLR